jgi:hypothetical protein
MKMKEEIKKSAYSFVGLKTGQQLLHDLNGIFKEHTNLDYARFGIEQICKLGSAITGAYLLDKIISHTEARLPQSIRGMFPLLASTIGIGTVMHFAGDYLNLEETPKILDATKQVISNYQQSLTQLITFDPNLNAGYLAGSLVAIKSGARLIKNIGKSFIKEIEKQNLEEKLKEIKD